MVTGAVSAADVLWIKRQVEVKIKLLNSAVFISFISVFIPFHCRSHLHSEFIVIVNEAVKQKYAEIDTALQHAYRFTLTV